MKGMFWDREGNEIEDVLTWAPMLEDPEYRIVAVDQDEPGTPMVSTIWEGINGALMEATGPFETFETVLLVKDPDKTPDHGRIVHSVKTSSEAEALEQHEAYCHRYLKRPPAPHGGLKAEIVRRELKAKDEIRRVREGETDHGGQQDGAGA